MMKKLRIASGVLAVCACFAFAACGETNGGNESGNVGGNESGNNKTEPAPAITAAQWESAFGVENFLKDVKIVVKASGELDGERDELQTTLTLGGTECGSYSIDSYISADDGQEAEHTVAIAGDGFEDFYYQITGDDSESGEDAWEYERRDATDYAADGYALWIENVLVSVEYTYLSNLADAYASFRCDSETCTYTGSEGLLLADESEFDDEGNGASTSFTATAVTVTFADNKLSAISIVGILHQSLKIGEFIDITVDVETSVSYEFTYGSQTVEAPDGVDMQI